MIRSVSSHRSSSYPRRKIQGKRTSLVPSTCESHETIHSDRRRTHPQHVHEPSVALEAAVGMWQHWIFAYRRYARVRRNKSTRARRPRRRREGTSIETVRGWKTRDERSTSHTSRPIHFPPSIVVACDFEREGRRESYGARPNERIRLLVAFRLPSRSSRV